MKTIIATTLFAAVTLLSGCAPKPPGCSDAETADVVSQIFYETTTESFKSLTTQSPDNAEAAKRVSELRLDLVRTDGYDEKSRKHVCQGNAILQFKDTPQIRKVVANVVTLAGNKQRSDAATALIPDIAALSGLAARLEQAMGLPALDLSGVRIDGLTVSVPISYISQATEANRHYVEVEGLQPLVDVLINIVARGHLAQPDSATSPDGQAARQETAPAQSAMAATPEAVAAVDPALLAALGKHPSEAAAETAIHTLLERVLGPDLPLFEESLSVASDVTRVGNALFGSGCMPHQCTVTEGAYAIDLDSGRAFAALLSDGKVRVYGGSVSELPSPLKKWHDERAQK